MKAEHINPFIQASQIVIQEITGMNPMLGKIYIKNSLYDHDHIIVLIGLTGELEGNVIMSLKESLACKISSIMLGGTTITVVDEMTISAISELCNMILGKVAGIFAVNNINVDITPPSILNREAFLKHQPKATLICIPLEFAGGEYVHIDITYKPK